jgi:hypothetical protein
MGFLTGVGIPLGRAAMFLIGETGPTYSQSKQAENANHDTSNAV